MRLAPIVLASLAFILATPALADDGALDRLIADYEAYSLSHEDIVRGTRLREALRGPPSAVKDDRIARALES